MSIRIRRLHDEDYQPASIPHQKNLHTNEQFLLSTSPLPQSEQVKENVAVMDLRSHRHSSKPKCVVVSQSRPYLLRLLFTMLTRGKGVGLINPIDRFAEHEVTLPPPGFPVLQTNFTIPPDCGETSYQGSGRLQGLNVLITGGDSGIGRATVIAFAREGANVAINYLPGEEPDAQDLEDLLAGEDLTLTRIPGDLDDENFCSFVVEEAARRLGGLDILIGNAGYEVAGPTYAL
jgi:hypothetical protein